MKMRFFTKELWSNCNSNNADVRERANAEWIKNSNEYRIELCNSKKHLSESFWSLFQAKEELHDYSIVKIDIEIKNNHRQGVVLLKNGRENLRLYLYELKSIKIDADLLNSDNSLLTWGYSEIEYTSKNTIKLSIICEINNELSFECKSIELTSTQQTD